MTQVLNLPFMANLSFEITRDADWLDSLFFSAPGSPQAIITMIGSIIAGNSAITMTTAAGLVPGQPIAPGGGIAVGAYVGSIPTVGTVQMVDINGNPLNALGTNAAVSLSFEPLPLDLTGIEFRSMLRSAEGDAQVYLETSTAEGTMINGGQSGVLSWNVKQPQMADVRAGDYVLDILAYGDGNTVNLLPGDPAQVTLSDGVTDAPVAASL
jgi:hypothetical protein